MPSRPACRWGSGRAGERGGSGRRIGAASPRGRPPASCGQQRQHSNEHGGCAVTSGQPAERGEGAWGGEGLRKLARVLSRTRFVIGRAARCVRGRAGLEVCSAK